MLKRITTTKIDKNKKQNKQQKVTKCYRKVSICFSNRSVLF